MLELITPIEAAIADRAMAERGIPLEKLMENAGFGVADAVAAETGYGVSIIVIAGPGDNGGDAFVAAEVLRTRGFKIALVDLSEGKGGAAARAAHARYRGRAAHARYRGQTISPDDPSIARADIIVDGLFGAGLTSPIAGPAAALVTRVNAAKAKVFAIDLPSGVNGATGAVEGPAIMAHRTVAFERRKPGHLLYPGRAHAGRVRVVEIGIDAAAIAAAGAQTFANEPALWQAVAPRLHAQGHKYRRGHAVIVSGAMSATGAARLASMACLRAGAGLVTLASPGDAMMVNAAHLTTVMVSRVDDARALAAMLGDERLNAVCVGPGLAPNEETVRWVNAALGSDASVVLDAGALSAFAGASDALCAAATARTVLTPHEGEFARLFARKADKLSDARRAARAVGGVVVLKGADTVIASPDGRAAINANAPATLATAGTGDVLAGIITAMLAQRVPPFEAAAMAVWLHGDAATRAGAGMIADDLVDALRPTMAAFATRLEQC